MIIKIKNENGVEIEEIKSGVIDELSNESLKTAHYLMNESGSIETSFFNVELKSGFEVKIKIN